MASGFIDACAISLVDSTNPSRPRTGVRRRSQGAVQFPTGGDGDLVIDGGSLDDSIAQARGRFSQQCEEDSRFGVIPKPTVQSG
jgi:hypothetical protein